VQRRLRDGVSARCAGLDWETEYDIAGTPVDVAGVGVDELVLVELEWRRADPADNTAKLFRHLDSGEIAVPNVTVVQLFTAYYDLARGGISSKRKNATFVGRAAADAFESVRYRPLDLAIDPPKRGGPRPDGWRETVDSVVERLVEIVESGEGAD